MTCEEFQINIWSGQIDYATFKHLETCEACRRAHEDVQSVLGGLRAMEDEPKPTRSLQPEASLIRSTVRKNRFLRKLRSTSTAAGLTILLGAAAGYGLHHSGTSPNAGAGGECKCAAPQNATTIAGGLAGGSAGTAFDAAAPSSADSKAVALRVEVQTDYEETRAVAQFLQEVLPVNQVRRVLVKDFKQEATDGANIIGTAALVLELQAEDQSMYTEGEQEAVVELSRADGGLKVVPERSEPGAAFLNPQQVAALWVQSLHNRRGVEEFRLFSPGLKRKARDLYRQSNWTNGMSKPSPSGFKIVRETQTNDSERVYELELTMPGSDPYPAELTLRKYADGWCIDKVVYSGGSPANGL